MNAPHDAHSPASPLTGGAALPAAQARLGLTGIFASTFFELVGYFMLAPWLLLQLKADGVSTATAGLFAACGWLGVFLMTPFASAITQRLGRRTTLWLSALVPLLAGVGFAVSESVPVWFAMQLIAGMASGLRWVLAEAVVAEFSPPGQRGRYVGLYETMVGTTFVLGPVLLAWLGADHPHALWVALVFMAAGVAWSWLIPPLPPAPDAGAARVGLGGVWHALRAHPVIMGVGMVGGFFESGITSILPLYGLALGLGVATATLLVSASGLGSTLAMLPAGLVADRMAHHPRQRWGNERAVRLRLMHGCAIALALVSALLPWVTDHAWLAAPVVFAWGAAGGSLYTLAMIDIGSREQGLTLVNSTAVLVMAYTTGGLLAPALGAAALQWSPALGFPALMLCTALGGWGLLAKVRAKPDRASTD